MDESEVSLKDHAARAADGDPVSLEQPEPDVVNEVAYAQLCGDVRISCTYGMLQCLSREQRITYLLGDLVGLSDTDGAAVLDISRSAYRKRLQRARDTMREVIANRCGLVRAANPCRCGGIIEASIEHGLLDPERPAWAAHPRVDPGSDPVRRAGRRRRAARHR